MAELTGNAPSKSGAIFKISERVNAGNAKLSFDIFTGGGGNGGADGFAMTVIDLPNVAALETISPRHPRCLAYGVTGGCAANMIVDAFHVEIDTWHNLIPNNPTKSHQSKPHRGHPDGNLSDHKLWAAIPTIEDQQWHTVDVDISGNYVSVKLDGSSSSRAKSTASTSVAAISGLAAPQAGPTIGIASITSLLTRCLPQPLKNEERPRALFWCGRRPRSLGATQASLRSPRHPGLCPRARRSPTGREGDLDEGLVELSGVVARTKGAQIILGGVI